jgi:hypothetical protein
MAHRPLCPFCPLWPIVHCARSAHYGPLCALQPALCAPGRPPSKLPGTFLFVCLFRFTHRGWVAKWRHSQLYHISHQESQSAQDLDPPATSDQRPTRGRFSGARPCRTAGPNRRPRGGETRPLPKKVNKKPFQTSFLDLGFSTAQKQNKKRAGAGRPEGGFRAGPAYVVYDNPPDKKLALDKVDWKRLLQRIAL